MTFSDSRVVSFINEHFLPAWESVSGVTNVIYDLGEGREVHATMNGEIAIYFCRPDGVVFDIVPGLQSPKVTYQAMQRAFAFYEETGATDAAILDYHREALAAQLRKDGTPEDQRSLAASAWTRFAAWRMFAPRAMPAATPGQVLYAPKRLPKGEGDSLEAAQAEEMQDTLREMSRKVVVRPTRTEAVLIVQPRGMALTATELHAAFLAGPPRPPAAWKSYIFETLLGQALDGGETVRFDIESDEGSLSIVPGP